jgi:hypothetical protein
MVTAEYMVIAVNVLSGGYDNVDLHPLQNEPLSLHDRFHLSVILQQGLFHSHHLCVLQKIVDCDQITCWNVLTVQRIFGHPDAESSTYLNTFCLWITILQAQNVHKVSIKFYFL